MKLLADNSLISPKNGARALSFNLIRVPSFIFLSILLVPISAFAVFNTPGEFGVSDQGSAAYTIPLQLPPGTSGMAPQLSLEYNSQGGNGILGLKWELSGLSGITRCPKTIAQDGSKTNIKYDSNDRYCLDGQRLIATSGEYGADGTEYRTELETHSRIVSYGTAGSGPAWFKVWTKGGLIVEFGNTNDSRIEAQGKASVRIWAFNKASDRNGNYLTAIYSEDTPNGEAYLNRLDYTGNANANPVLNPYASVRFIYATRPDTGEDKINGSIIKITKRLTNIKTYLGESLVKDYRVAYVNNGVYSSDTNGTSNGSLLTSVTECDGSGVCLNPTTFSWTPGTKLTSTFDAPVTGGPANIVAAGETNNDGLADALRYNYDGVCNTSTTTLGKFYYTKSTGSSMPAGTQLTTLYGLGGARQLLPATTIVCDVLWPKAFFGDVNLDGKDDYIATVPGYGTGTVTVRLSNGNGFDAVQTWTDGVVIAVGDVNGDGRTDILYDTRTATTAGTLHIGLSTGTGLSNIVNTGISGGSFICATSSGCGGYFYIHPEVSMGDVDGDGLADLIVGSNYYLSTGSGFGTAKNWGGGGRVVAVADISGDGRADIVLDTTTSTTIGKLWVAFSTGEGFSGAFDTGIPGRGYICVLRTSVSSCPNYLYAPPFVALVDMNGDGRADLFTGDGKYRLVSVAWPDLVTTITDGLGKTTNITHQPVSNPSVYSSEAGAVYPKRNLPSRVPIFVVSSVSSSDGIGGTASTNYQYGGAVVDMQGRSFLGFRWFKTTDSETGVNFTKFVRQDYPYIGLVSQLEKRTSAGVLLSASQYSYSTQALGTTRHFPFVLSLLENNYELDGTAINSTTTSYEYDDFGNVIKLTVTSSDGHSKTNTNYYSNDSSNWILGRLLRSTVTSVVP